MRLILTLGFVFALLAGTAGAMTTAEIDAMLAKSQAEAGVVAAGPADDAEFFRRLSLDVRGVIPTVEETLAFIEDESPDKREVWIEKFLASPERGEHWADYWDKILLGTLEQPQNPTAQVEVKKPFKEWAAEQFNNNTPFSTFMREIVDAHGATNEVAQAMPLARWRDMPESMAGTMSRAFLGTQIQCAQCHDHKENPELTQQKFWEFAAFFANTRAIQIRDESRNNRLVALDVRDVGSRWQVTIPDVEPKKQVSPKYLDGTAATRTMVDETGREVSRKEQLQAARQLQEARDNIKKVSADTNDMYRKIEEARRNISYVHDNRRAQLANMILGRDSEQFSANMVNRVWARYFGRGLLEPVDAWQTGIEPDHPELLYELTVHFRGTGYDVRDLERLILNTQAYQRSSQPTETSAAYPEEFAHAAVRPLSPEQLLASLVQATDAEGTLQGPGRDRGKEQLERLKTAYAAQFIHTFGNDEMEWTSTFESSVPRALFLLNDSGLNNVIRSTDEHNVITRIGNTTNDPQEQAKYLYLAALSRLPNDSEREFLSGEIARGLEKGKKEWRAVMEDAFWALLNSTEFMTNH